jgi:hypothetical protein
MDGVFLFFKKIISFLDLDDVLMPEGNTSVLLSNSLSLVFNRRTKKEKNILETLTFAPVVISRSVLRTVILDVKIKFSPI